MANEGFELTDPISMNVEGVHDLVRSKMNRTGRGTGGSTAEGPQEPEVDNLELKMSDEELLLLASQWEQQYAGYEGRIRSRQKVNETYYKGQQKGNYSSYAYDDTPIASNYIFPALETFLAAALAKNPDPVVWSDDSPEGKALSGDTQTMLQFHADMLSLRPKLAAMVRQHSINYLGVLKHGWDEYENSGCMVGDIKLELRPIENFIFDKRGYVDVEGDFIGYLGERIKLTARELIDLFPDFKSFITLQVEGHLGTEVTYTEWWTDKYTFSTFMGVVLEKKKNYFFKYEGRNHFAKPKKPYTFLSIFSLMNQPHDITSLIEQNIPNQNLISKEVHQLDYNIARNNNSTAFSENNFNQQTAKQATQAWIKGHNVLVPPGVPIQEAIVNFPVTPIPESFFKFLESNIQTLQLSFGIQGLTAQQPNEETTARGMILNQQRDNQRIGGAISEKIEGVAKNVFNWWAQMYHVFYDEKHFGAILGIVKGIEYVTLSAASFDRQLIVSVAPDSMKPKDEITAMNQAQQLWEAGALGLKTFLTLQKVSDVEEAAEDALLWKAGLMPYIQIQYPELMQKLQSLGMGGSPAGPTQTATPPMAGSPTPTEGQPPVTGGEPPSAALSQVPLPQ
ncbi:MAG: hypothetical protein KGJ90_02180 [Patescibacteria group bacterium]|nr:hypothetical protein [Patescibacteria group bacterium]